MQSSDSGGALTRNNVLSQRRQSEGGYLRRRDRAQVGSTNGDQEIGKDDY
jgi:hypothetical protein